LEFNVPFQHKYGYIRDETFMIDVVSVIKLTMQIRYRSYKFG